MKKMEKSPQKLITFSKVKLEKEDIDAASQVLDGSMLVQGKKVQEFEEEIKKKFKVKNAILVNSGTSALHLSLLSLGIKQGDTVAVPSFTFIGSVNAIYLTGAKPIFIDIDEKTFQISIKDLKNKIQSSTKAIMPVHLYGGSCDMHKLYNLAKQHSISIVEDAAQAIGSKFKEKYLGSIGDIGCFSLYATKNITSIEGGIVITDREEIANKIRLYRNQGMKASYEYLDYGLNNRMTEVQAAIGSEQFKRLDKITERRREIAKEYRNHIKNKAFILPEIDDDEVFHVYHQFTIKIIDSRRDDFILYMKKHSIETKIIYQTPVHMSLPYKKLYQPLPITEKIIDQIISLPIHHHLSNEDVQYIIDVINSWE